MQSAQHRLREYEEALANAMARLSSRERGSFRWTRTGKARAPGPPPAPSTPGIARAWRLTRPSPDSLLAPPRPRRTPPPASPRPLLDDLGDLRPTRLKRLRAPSPRLATPTDQAPTDPAALDAKKFGRWIRRPHTARQQRQGWLCRSSDMNALLGVFCLRPTSARRRCKNN